MPDPSRAVLITGCSSGIGRATALRLARADRPVWATARRLEDLSDLAAAGCRTLALDVTAEGSMRAAVGEIERTAGAVGALVNNAGYSQSGTIEQTPLELVRRQFETNVFGLIRLTQLVLPGMRRQSWGRIVNLGSMGGRLTFPAGGCYHATKHALEAISDALRFEVAGFGVYVTLIQPGLIRTGFSARAVRDWVPASDDSPYAPLEREAARLTEQSYESGAWSKLAGEADDVARVIEQALEAKNPRPRYPVAPSARLLMTMRRTLGDRLWDAFLARYYPRPGR